MSISSIISEMDAEIASLTQARTILAGISTGTRGGISAAPSAVKPKRTLSAAARKKIARAQRKRWAKVRKAAK